ncbi:MAG: hypothetical protein ACP5HQ_08385 [Thermoprotei archaeon]
MKRVKGMIVAFPSAEVMERVLREAGIRPEEVEDVSLEGKDV